ncbi:hypothetical protein ACVWY3_004125 [Bradyrhizobium sp. USDA 4486]
MRVPARVRHSLTVPLADLIGRANELAQLDEIDLSGGIGGAAELLGEQAVHHAIAPSRVQASCLQISAFRIPGSLSFLNRRLRRSTLRGR